MNIAYFSPLNPQRSGISDYSEEILPYLAEGADITLFVDGFQPVNQSILTQFQYLDYRRDPSHLNRLHEFDAVIYHMGNDHRYHSGMLHAMHSYPGIVVFHDFALQDFFLGLARAHNALDIYLDEVGACHGEQIRQSAAAALTRGAVPDHVEQPTLLPLNRRLAQAAEGIIVHSHWSRARFEKIAPAVPVTQINMPVRSPSITAAKTAQASSREITIANFGLITPGKGIEQALRVLANLKDEYSFRYNLVGEPSPFFPVHELIERYGLRDRVQVIGHVSLDEFERQMRATDIALNMRERTVGETSASLCRIMAAGVCSIVSAVGWYAELPDNCVVKVPIDSHSDALLLAYLRRLIEDKALRSQIGKNARLYALTEHNLDSSARKYLDFISTVIACRPQRKLITAVSHEISQLHLPETNNNFMSHLAAEIASLVPGQTASKAPYYQFRQTDGHTTPALSDSMGRLAKLAGVDYKRAAVEYPRKLDPERNHYLRTKPFYNLANKPDKHRGDGMDSETHRHFCDFANIAVALSLPAGAKILEVGCGSGWLSEYFARLGYDITGIDISDDLVAMARERVAGVPYKVDHETAIQCRFLVQDVEEAPLPEKFDAVICYDSLHHMEDERAVLSHVAAMLEVGGLLFILEGHKPPANSPTEAELFAVMQRYETLESPFSYEYLLELLDEKGFAVVGDYVSINGLFEREMLKENALPLQTLPVDYHYLTCMKIAGEARASSIPNSRRPGVLRARISAQDSLPKTVAPGVRFEISLEIENTGDTLWLTGQTVRAGIVMPAVKVFDSLGKAVKEFHGQPMLPRAVAPGQSVSLRIEDTAPLQTGTYTIKIDLVNQHICWFEDQGSTPLTLTIEVA